MTIYTKFMLLCTKITSQNLPFRRLFYEDAAKKGHEQLCRATGTNTSEQSAKLSRSSSCSPGSSSRPIYDGGKKKKISYRSQAPYFSARRVSTVTAIPGIIRIKFLGDLRRIVAELQRHIMSISLFARFSSDKRQSRAVDCLQGLANRRDSQWNCRKNVTTSHNNFIPSTFSFEYTFSMCNGNIANRASNVFEELYL